MAVIEIGRVCWKIAGRDAGNVCLVVKNLDKNFVMVDGNTRRRKCNIEHLEFSDQVADIKENANHAEVVSALSSLGFKVVEKRPAKTKVAKKAEAAPKAEEKPAKKASAKATPAKKAKK